MFASKLPVFFDIDGTLINSHARFMAACTKGYFDVAYYRERQTDEELAKDTPLPLLAASRYMFASSYVLTAREMLPADMRQLVAMGINCRHVYHRGNAPASIAAIQDNGEYKRRYLNHLRLTEFSSVKECGAGWWAHMYDDDAGVLAIGRRAGVKMFDAVVINEVLQVRTA